MKRPLINAFKEGFIGSFILAAVIVMAIPKAITEFVNHRSQQHRNC